MRLILHLVSRIRPGHNLQASSFSLNQLQVSKSNEPKSRSGKRTSKSSVKSFPKSSVGDHDTVDNSSNTGNTFTNIKSNNSGGISNKAGHSTFTNSRSINITSDSSNTDNPSNTGNSSSSSHTTDAQDLANLTSGDASSTKKSNRRLPRKSLKKVRNFETLSTSTPGPGSVASAAAPVVVVPDSDPESSKWSCSVCSKKFRFKSRLERHSIVHRTDDEGRRFECRTCNKKFLRPGSITLL